MCCAAGGSEFRRGTVFCLANPELKKDSEKGDDVTVVTVHGHGRVVSGPKSRVLSVPIRRIWSGVRGVVGGTGTVSGSRPTVGLLQTGGGFFWDRCCVAGRGRGGGHSKPAREGGASASASGSRGRGPAGRGPAGMRSEWTRAAHWRPAPPGRGTVQTGGRLGARSLTAHSEPIATLAEGSGPGAAGGPVRVQIARGAPAVRAWPPHGGARARLGPCRCGRASRRSPPCPPAAGGAGRRGGPDARAARRAGTAGLSMGRGQ